MKLHFHLQDIIVSVLGHNHFTLQAAPSILVNMLPIIPWIFLLEMTHPNFLIKLHILLHKCTGGIPLHSVVTSVVKLGVL